jgi:hypothetical protein
MWEGIIVRPESAAKAEATGASSSSSSTSEKCGRPAPSPDAIRTGEKERLLSSGGRKKNKEE